MINNDEGCIRYLMQEMDPAEEIEFEREMLNNQDLLIEVESLRRTYKKLGKLQLINPPNDFIEQVKQNAVRVQKHQTHRSKIIFIKFAKAVASAAAAILIVSSTLYFNDYFKSTPIDNTSTIQAIQNSNVQPWVDKNEIIKFAGTEYSSASSKEFDEEINHSLDKLKLVDNKAGFTPNNKKVVLVRVSQ